MLYSRTNIATSNDHLDAMWRKKTRTPSSTVSGEAQGRLYLGEAAVENEHYNKQYALVANLGNGVGVRENLWW